MAEYNAFRLGSWSKIYSGNGAGRLEKRSRMLDKIDVVLLRNDQVVC